MFIAIQLQGYMISNHSMFHLCQDISFMGIHLINLINVYL